MRRLQNPTWPRGNAFRMQRRGVLPSVLSAMVLLLGCGHLRSRVGPPVSLAVLDPLAAPLSCPCKAGYGQRRYDLLAEQLEKRLRRPVLLRFQESLHDRRFVDAPPDIVIGPLATLQHEADALDLAIRPVAMLSDAEGNLTQRGLLVVRHGDPATHIEHLAGSVPLIGPAWDAATHDAALRLLEAFGLLPDDLPPSVEGASTAALAVEEGEVRAAFVNGAVYPLLAACGTIGEGTLRILAKTDPVPGIALATVSGPNAPAPADLTAVLRRINRRAGLLAHLESRDGFVPVTGAPHATATWPDWRGPQRTASDLDLPASIRTPRLLWRRTLTGPSMAGVAVSGSRLMVGDKNVDATVDTWRCLDADTGNQLWRLDYPAAGEMDFTNTARATPVIAGDRVFLLGAFGELHCVSLTEGQVLWRVNILSRFAAERPSWGVSATPLLVAGRLIINPGAPAASLAALDPETGETLWTTPGNPAAYASLVAVTAAGRTQVIGYDAVSLGGWAVEDGRRLWTIVPEHEGDFNVPTPIPVPGGFIVATENNGTRRYSFGPDGIPSPSPTATNLDLAPDTATPVLLDGLLYGGHDALLCLDPDDGLATRWLALEHPYARYSTILAGNRRLLVLSQTGDLSFVKATGDRYGLLGRWQLFPDDPDTDRDVWSHPAFVGGRLYVRNGLGISCFVLQPWPRPLLKRPCPKYRAAPSTHERYTGPGAEGRARY